VNAASSATPPDHREAAPAAGWIRAALEREVLPHADLWEERGRIPAAGWRALAGAGLLRLPHSGPGFRHSAVLLEELGRTGYAGIRAAVAVHAYMAASYLPLLPTARQRNALRAGVRRGERVGALAISEQGAGTDLLHLATVAAPARAPGPGGAEGYRLTGRKVHVANGSQGGFLVVLARTRPSPPSGSLAGLSLFLVDGPAPGLTAVAEPMLGWRAADICRVELDDVFVPEQALLGRSSYTLSYLFRALRFERLTAGLLAVGGAAHAIDLVDSFARTHRINNAPLAANQAVRHGVADLVADLELVRQYGRHAARLQGRGDLDDRTASVLKLKATELAAAAARTCLQYHGARGYLADSTVSRVFRDAAAGTIAAGASELMLEMVFGSGGPDAPG